MDGKQRQPALARAADAMVRALGGAAVSLRFASGAPQGLERELGLTATTYQELELAPVVLRSMRRKEAREGVELLVSSHALDTLMPACGVANGMELLKRVQAIVSNGRVFVVTGVSAESFAGLEYMYRLTAVEDE